MSCGHCLLDFSLRLLLPFSVFFAAQHSTQKSLLSPSLTQAYVSSHQKRRKMRLSFSDKTIWVRFLSSSTVWRNRVYRYAVTPLRGLLTNDGDIVLNIWLSTQNSFQNTCSTYTLGLKMAEPNDQNPDNLVLFYLLPSVQGDSLNFRRLL